MGKEDAEHKDNPVANPAASGSAKSPEDTSVKLEAQLQAEPDVLTFSEAAEPKSRDQDVGIRIIETADRSRDSENNGSSD